MMLGQRDLRAKASMQCLFGLVNGPYFILFSRIGFNFKVVILGHPGLASHLRDSRRGVEQADRGQAQHGEGESHEVNH